MWDPYTCVAHPAHRLPGNPATAVTSRVLLCLGADQRRNRLIETGGGRWGFALAFVRSRWAGSRTACRPPAVWLQIEVPACRVLAVVWLERGASARRSGSPRSGRGRRALGPGPGPTRARPART